MTVVTHARRKSRLSRIIDDAGGISIGTALAQARSNLAALEPRSAAEVADRIADLAAIQPPAEGDDPTPALGAAYRAANGVIDGTGPFDMDDIRAVALGLCDLIDAATPERPFDWRVLPLYAQSLQLLLSMPDDPEGRQTVRASLSAMVDRKLTQPG